jgi:hypothetical protein
MNEFKRFGEEMLQPEQYNLYLNNILRNDLEYGRLNNGDTVKLVQIFCAQSADTWGHKELEHLKIRFYIKVDPSEVFPSFQEYEPSAAAKTLISQMSVLPANAAILRANYLAWEENWAVNGSHLTLAPDMKELLQTPIVKALYFIMTTYSNHHSNYESAVATLVYSLFVALKFYEGSLQVMPHFKLPLVFGFHTNRADNPTHSTADFVARHMLGDYKFACINDKALSNSKPQLIAEAIALVQANKTKNSELTKARTKKQKTQHVPPSVTPFASASSIVC